MLAYSLICRGLIDPEDFLLVDAGLTYSSSLISTGILNPLVFKRMTLSWGSELLPLAWDMYEGLEFFLNEQGYGVEFLHRTNIIHLFTDDTERMRWEEEPVLRPYLADVLPADELPGSHGGGSIRDSGWIDAGILLEFFRKYLRENGQLIEKQFTAEHCTEEVSNGLWKQENITFEKIILCTGIQYRYSFDYRLPDYRLPFYPVKGDLLTLKLPRTEELMFTTGQIIGNKVMLQALNGGLLRAGSSYVRDFDDASPSTEGRQWILSELCAMGLGSRAELEQAVTAQKAGIRPASRDRLAYLGPLPLENSDRVVVFNGLGTRGFMLAPGLSENLTDWLLDGLPLPEELSPGRMHASDAHPGNERSE